jgi:hypothetical protein
MFRTQLDFLIVHYQFSDKLCINSNSQIDKLTRLSDVEKKIEDPFLTKNLFINRPNRKYILRKYKSQY